MDKLRELGRRALFVIRVLSGYEERRIRTYRLQLEKQIVQAQERKAALKKAPEQLILSEEAAIDEYFKPIDKNAEMIMNMQLDKEEKNMKEMVKAMQQHALLRKNAAEQIAKLGNLDGSRPVDDEVKGTSKNLKEAK